MLADPTFEGLEELKTTLADLAAKRDALSAKMEQTKPATTPVKESDLRAWAAERFEQMEKVMAKAATIVEARALIHSTVDRIEIDSQANTGVLYLTRDVYSSFVRGASTMGSPQDQGIGKWQKGKGDREQEPAVSLAASAKRAGL